MGVSMYLVFNNKLGKPTQKLNRLLLFMFTFVAYLFIGALIHQLLNYDQDLDQQQSLIDNLVDFIQNQSECINRTDVNFLFGIIDEALDKGIKLNSKMLRNDTSSSSSFESNWLFGGETLFFTFTLLTTIGYGHLAPSTPNGKLFCIFYISLGVPLTLVLLQSIVNRLELTFLGSNEETRKLMRLKSSKTKKNAKKNQLAAVNSSLISSSSNDLNNSNSSSSSSSFNESNQLIDNEKKTNKKYSTISNDSSNEQLVKVRTTQPKRKLYSHYYKLLFTLILILILFVYLLPAYILSVHTEEKWSFLDSIYYIYISVSTIGFGDFVPGTDKPGPYRNYYRLAITCNLLI